MSVTAAALGVLALAVAFAAVAFAVAAREVSRTYLAALDRRTQHSPVAELETRQSALEHRLKALEVRGMVR